jgi:hypothetical protein
MSLIFSQLFGEVYDTPYQAAFLKVVPTYAVSLKLAHVHTLVIIIVE